MFVCWRSACGRVRVGHWGGQKARSTGNPDESVKTRDVKTLTGMCRVDLDAVPG